MQHVPSPDVAPPTPEPGDPLAAKLRGFGPVGILAMVAIVAVGPLPGAILSLIWAVRSRTPWREIGYVRPRSWVAVIAAGIALGISLKLGMKSVVMPLLGADPINQAYHDLVGNRAALAGMLFSVTVGAGWGEETVYRGFLFERLGKLLGRGAGASSAIVVLTSILFGAVHYPVQGLAGAEQGFLVGLIYGGCYALTGRLWLSVSTHAAFDITAVFIIFWDLEVAVAQYFFRPVL